MTRTARFMNRDHDDLVVTGTGQRLEDPFDSSWNGFEPRRCKHRKDKLTRRNQILKLI